MNKKEIPSVGSADELKAELAKLGLTLNDVTIEEPPDFPVMNSDGKTVCYVKGDVAMAIFNELNIEMP